MLKCFFLLFLTLKNLVCREYMSPVSKVYKNELKLKQKRTGDSENRVNKQRAFTRPGLTSHVITQQCYDSHMIACNLACKKNKNQVH